ncbi:hypothetical protein ABMA28_009613 [Loxostege sticticalis]|uniref:BTB domain-containing protein n=1 Tax=Loxostege sticticalis TaxID=481309 RepID=A0ABD0SBJ7_LOXSC
MSSLLSDVKSRIQKMFETKELADCTFLVGEEKLPVKGHKLILSVASPVLQGMLKEVSENHPKITITDTEPEVFQAILKYIYTDAVDVNGKIVYDVATAAKSYQIPGLLKACLDRITADDLTPKKILEAYSLVLHTTDCDLKKKCEEIIKTKTKEVLADSSFVEACLDVVEAVLSMENLEIDSELDLLKAVDRYAKHDPSCDETSIRNVLAKIRFLSVTPEDFAKALSTTSVLAASDALAILAHLVFDKSEVPMPPGFSQRREGRNKETIIAIKNLTETRFRLNVENLSSKEKNEWEVWSTTLFLHSNLKLKVYIKKETQNLENFLSVNLKCNLESESEWSCKVVLEAFLLRDDNEKGNEKRILPKYSKKNQAIGMKFITISDLLNPNNHFIKDGVITFGFKINLDELEVL